MNPTLTQEEKRVRIAEAIGWKWYRWGDHPDAPLFLCTPHHDWSKGSFVPATRKPNEPFRSDCPDYFNDLNACHEMERHAQNDLMNATQWAEYGRTLMRLHDTASLTCPVTDESDLFYEIAQIATVGAAIRAEAFGRTLNLWN